MAGLVLIALGLMLISRLEESADESLRDGVRTEAVVESLTPPARLQSMFVTYRVDGRTYRSRIRLTVGSPEYRAGERITVLYDPTDPAA